MISKKRNIAVVFSAVSILLSGAYIVRAVTGQSPNLLPADSWGLVRQGVDPGYAVSDTLWNGLVNAAGDRSIVDFSVAGTQTTFLCTPTRTNFRSSTLPGPGVKGAIYNFRKTSGQSVRARLYSTSGIDYGVIFSGSWESHSDCSIIETGDFVMIPVNANGYFACESIPQRGTNVDIQLTLIAYIY
jgi:hypothetical protein